MRCILIYFSWEKLFCHLIYRANFKNRDLFSVIFFSVTKPCPDTIFCQPFANWNFPYSWFRQRETITFRFLSRL